MTKRKSEEQKETGFTADQLFRPYDPEPPKTANLYRFWLDVQDGLDLDFGYIRRVNPTGGSPEGKIAAHTRITMPYWQAKDMITQLWNVMQEIERNNRQGPEAFAVELEPKP